MMQYSDFAPINPNPQIQVGLEAMRAATITTSMETVHLYDIVRLGNGDQMIVTQVRPSRPANPFCGVLVSGKGAEYKFGPRHRPTVIGKAQQDHPALVALRARHAERAGAIQPQVGQDATAVIFHLLEAVEAGDMAKARILTAAIRTMGQFHK